MYAIKSTIIFLATDRQQGARHRHRDGYLADLAVNVTGVVLHLITNVITTINVVVLLCEKNTELIKYIHVL